MPDDSDRKQKKARTPFIERRTRRIANARSVTVALAATFLGLALMGAVVIRIVDQHDFPSLGLAVWWALQTVTTVGYGDVTPTTTAGRVIGGAELVLSISFIAFLTAGVTGTVIQRGQAQAVEAGGAASEKDRHAMIDALAQTRGAIAELNERLDRIESRLGN
jgi:voltage-gated potassium channel